MSTVDVCFCCQLLENYKTARNAGKNVNECLEAMKIGCLLMDGGCVSGVILEAIGKTIIFMAAQDSITQAIGALILMAEFKRRHGKLTDHAYTMKYCYCSSCCMKGHETHECPNSASWRAFAQEVSGRTCDKTVEMCADIIINGKKASHEAHAFADAFSASLETETREARAFARTFSKNLEAEVQVEGRKLMKSFSSFMNSF
jgi:hypothetical protein